MTILKLSQPISVSGEKMKKMVPLKAKPENNCSDLAERIKGRHIRDLQDVYCNASLRNRLPNIFTTRS
ncbi:MAG: hypothetical protein CMN32_08750 [Saprospirales bacterium]|nr:hypothetical protein [Saprospirales bacterium]